jgi:hypothetical protein
MGCHPPGNGLLPIYDLKERFNAGSLLFCYPLLVKFLQCIDLEKLRILLNYWNLAFSGREGVMLGAGPSSEFPAAAKPVTLTIIAKGR